MSQSRTFGFNGKRSQQGFTLIEVMIAVLIMGIGLLGFAMLQTMSVRFAQSANHRSQATNLAYGMLDQMRTNRIAATQYAGSYTGTATGCAPTGAVNAAAFRTVWQCRLQSSLGAGSSADVTYAAGVATVSITWGDERWTANPNRTFVVESRL